MHSSYPLGSHAVAPLLSFPVTAFPTGQSQWVRGLPLQNLFFSRSEHAAWNPEFLHQHPRPAWLRIKDAASVFTPRPQRKRVEVAADGAASGCSQAGPRRGFCEPRPLPHIL